jgi:hypothetical protein
MIQLNTSDSKLQFDDAIALAESMDRQGQLRVMEVFRGSYAGFPSVRDAFIGAVELEITNGPEIQGWPARLIDTTLRSARYGERHEAPGYYSVNLAIPLPWTWVSPGASPNQNKGTNNAYRRGDGEGTGGQEGGQECASFHPVKPRGAMGHSEKK